MRQLRLVLCLELQLELRLQTLLSQACGCNMDKPSKLELRLDLEVAFQTHTNAYKSLVCSSRLKLMRLMAQRREQSYNSSMCLYVWRDPGPVFDKLVLHASFHENCMLHHVAALLSENWTHGGQVMLRLKAQGIRSQSESVVIQFFSQEAVQ